jgi:hypothetical protein
VSDDNDKGNGDSGGSSHLRVVELQTADEKRKRACVLKLRELLAQAEQGKFLDLAFVAICGPTEHTMHWTQNVIVGSQQVRFVGALKLLQHIFLNSVKLTKL